MFKRVQTMLSLGAASKTPKVRAVTDKDSYRKTKKMSRDCSQLQRKGRLEIITADCNVNVVGGLSSALKDKLPPPSYIS